MKYLAKIEVEGEPGKPCEFSFWNMKKENHCDIIFIPMKYDEVKLKETDTTCPGLFNPGCPMKRIVMCKDCKGSINNPIDYYCMVHHEWMDENNYCSLGELKDNNV